MTDPLLERVARAIEALTWAETHDPWLVEKIRERALSQSKEAQDG